jgi:hypothetical protein
MYEDKRLPDFCQMQKIAWEIRSKNAGAAAGFVLGSDLEELQEEAPDQEVPGFAPAAKND